MARRIEIPISTPYNAKGAADAARALTALAKAEQAAAQASSKTAQSQNQASVSAQKLAQAQTQSAIAAQKLAQAEARTVADLIKIEAAQSKAALSALKLQQAQEKAAKPPGKGLAGFFEDIKNQAASAATGMLGFGAALGTAAAVAQSFKDAFDFKANLDATTASINIQLQGVRDSGQVWSAAAGYAEQYKLTQEETTSTVQASIGILRQSKASVEDTFGVLQRLTVLAPGKSIADAAFSVRELASGDITSIAEQFNISRAKAYEMRDAIVAGKDVVSVLSGFLDGAGVSMDSLKVRTEGAMGAMKDLAIAQEELKLAQAEFAQGPGLAALGIQIEATRGGTRLLMGDFSAMGDSLVQAFANGEPAAIALAQSLGVTGEAAQEAAQRYLEHKAAAEADAQAAQVQAGAVDATAAAVERAAAASAAAAEMNLMFANGMNGAEIAARAMADGTSAAARANDEAAAAALSAAGAIGEMLTRTLEDKAAKEEAEAQARMFAQAQEQIANLGGAVNAGLMTAAEGAALLARQYNITTNEALALINAQAAIAGGQARLAGQKRNTMDLVPGGVGASAPGKRGQSDADILATVQKTTDEITAVGVRAQPVRTAAVKAGGSARASAEQSAADKIKQIAEDAAARLVAIDQRAAEQRAKAQASLANAMSESSADMVANHEADDLELIGASEERIAELTAREQAQAQARIASINAVQEARAIADAGDAEQAQKVLDARQAQIAEQQQLDEDYAAKQAELAGNPEALAAAKQQYDEATQAFADAAQVRIDFAAQEAQQRAEALAAEKQAVLDNASAQAAALGTTGDAASAATAKVNDLISAINAIPLAKTVTVNVETKGGGAGSAEAAPSGGGGSGNKAGAGMVGVTSGPATITVGDNPGGVEIVSVTPVSGVGTTSISSGNIRMAGGGTAIAGASDDAIKRLEDANRRQIRPTGAAVAGGGTKAAAKAAAAAEKAAKPAIADYAKAAKDNLDLLSETLKIRQAVQDPATWMPINDAVLESAARDADKVARAFATIAATYDGPVLEAAKLYADALGGAYSVIKDGLEVSDLLRGSEALDMGSLARFETNAGAVLATVGRLGAMAATVPEASVSALGNVASTLAVLPSLGMLGGGGGGSNTNVGGVTVNIYPAAGMDARQIAAQVTQAIGQSWGSRK